MAFEFDNRISLGHLITLGCIGVTVAFAWRDASNSIESLAERSAAVSSTISSHESRIRAMEQTSARQDERVSQILAGINKLDAKLERLEQRR